MCNKEPILSIKGLKTSFFTEDGVLDAVDCIDLDLNQGETVAVVGESGSGKTVCALSVLRLLPSPPAKIVGGEILFKGVDLAVLGEKEIAKIRGDKISMIFQEPMTSLNPVMKIGRQVAEVVTAHRPLPQKIAMEQAVDMLRKVGIPEPEARAKDYPHQLSGGMRQRVMIAMALILKPELLIADEPTTAVDVTVQAQLLDLLKTHQAKEGMAVLLITHDLSIVREVADRVCVMYGSKIVEKGDCKDLLEHPLHPYTVGLINSSPMLDDKITRLVEIPGLVPDPLDFPTGCRFHPRCPKCEDICKSSLPELREIESRRYAACHILDRI